MEIQNFVHDYSDETSCMVFFRDLRMKHGVVCKKCGCVENTWLDKKWQFQCTSCGFRTTLRSGTVMENSRLPFSIWFMLMYYMQSTRKDISASDLKRLVGHHRYATVWTIMHKLQSLMAKKKDIKEINSIDDVEINIIALFKAFEVAA